MKQCILHQIQAYWTSYLNNSVQRKWCPIAWGYPVDFAVGLVNSAINLPMGKWFFFGGGIHITEEL